MPDQKIPAFGTYGYTKLADQMGIGTNCVFGEHARPTDPVFCACLSARVMFPGPSFSSVLSAACHGVHVLASGEQVNFH